MLLASPVLILKNNNLDYEGASKIKNNFYTFLNYLANSNTGIFIQSVATVTFYTSIFFFGFLKMQLDDITLFDLIEGVGFTILQSGALLLGPVSTILLFFLLMVLLKQVPNINVNFLSALIVLFTIVYPDVIIDAPMAILKGFTPIHWIAASALVYIALMRIMIKGINKIIEQQNLNRFIKYYFQVTFGLFPLFTYLHTFDLAYMA